MIEFVVILLSLLGVGSLFFGIEALGIIINFFIFILVGAICCIPIALGILLMLFFYSFGVFSSITIISIGQGKGFVSMEELLEVLAFSLLLGAFPSFGVGIWLDGKLLAMIKPPEE